MGGAFVAELIDTFVEDARELIATLRRALAEADLDAFRRAAHSLKSTGETPRRHEAGGARPRARSPGPGREPATGPAAGSSSSSANTSASPRALEELRRDLPA